MTAGAGSGKLPAKLDEPAVTLRSWRLNLVGEKPPLNANDRKHHMAVYRDRSNLTGQVRLLARHANIPRLERIHVVLHYLPSVRRVRDAENLTDSLKPCIDGLRDYGPAYKDGRLIRAAWTGIVADDDPTHVSWSPPVIHAPLKTQPGVPVVRLWLIVSEVTL